LELVLVPLHETSSFLNETTPLLAVYHEPLVFCVVKFIERSPTTCLPFVVKHLLDMWPSGHSSNSPKVCMRWRDRSVSVVTPVAWCCQEVLLIHELEQLIETGNDESFGMVMASVIPILRRCMGSDNSRVAQRALQMFSSERYRRVLLPLVVRLCVYRALSLPCT
jgi:hypothetical protein